MGIAPEEPSTNINHLRLTRCTATSHNCPEATSVQNLDPLDLDAPSESLL